jgi:DNA-binding cell septation regulator SpoVG
MKTIDRTVLSEIIITPIPPTAKGIVAFVSFVLNQSFKVTNVMIATSLKRGGAFRLVYPVQQLPNGKSIQIFYPINKEVGRELENQIFLQYKEFIDKMTKGAK